MSSTSTMTSTTNSEALPRVYSAILSSNPTSSSTSSPPSSPPNAVLATTASTLRSLYPRAARALLQKDFSLAYSLITSAFSILHPPQSPILDSLDPHRRKWDILRLTLETTVFVSPPQSSDPDSLPATLRSNLMLSASSLAASLHSRSVQLFTPTMSSESPSTAFLPAQILVVLVLSSLKLECPDVGRRMTEDWLAQREKVEYVRNDKEGYEKVVDLFCLHVLPRLHDWEYARDFLEYESELPDQSRQRMKNGVDLLREREIQAARTIPTPPPIPSPSLSSASSSNSTPLGSPSPARTPSPAPSVSSSSSTDTIDTTSTRTVVPHSSSRGKRGVNVTGLTQLTPATTNGHANGNAVKGASARAQVQPIASSSRSAAQPHPSTSFDHARRRTVSAPKPFEVTRSTDVLSIVSSYIRTYFTNSRLIFAALFLLVPLFSFILRVRKRKNTRTFTAATSSSASVVRGTSVEEVRRRLGSSESGGNVLSIAWRELMRAVVDAARMAGGGLV